MGFICLLSLCLHYVRTIEQEVELAGKDIYCNQCCYDYSWECI